jgi:RNA polymerase sigma-70 factor (ECF subfamily)
VTFVSLLARRRLVDRLRKQGRRPETTSLDQAEPHLGDDGQALLERSADVRRVRAVLETLEPRQREIIHLSSWLGLSHGAIAERTGMPLGTVKSHLRRGLMKVREQLGEAPAAADGTTP